MAKIALYSGPAKPPLTEIFSVPTSAVLALQRQEAFEESLLISAAIFSAIRRCPALARDESILPTVLLGCCSENPLAARHAFAVLADQATQSPDAVSQVRGDGGCVSTRPVCRFLLLLFFVFGGVSVWVVSSAM